MRFRFIHTGDIHLDSPLQGLSGQDGQSADRIRTATRAAFSNLVEYAIDEAVDFLIIAGDLYDGEWRDYRTGLFFVSQMARLSQAKIPVYLIYGNHDAESQITKRLTLPQNVHRFRSRKAQTFELKDLHVALHGQSYGQRDVDENLVPGYPTPIAGAFNIGILHTGLGGRAGHANYAPCSLDDLVNKGYDYWALAHVHQRELVHQNPHVVFCGNLQGRHIRENGDKSACLVTVEDRVVTEVRNIAMDVVRWQRLSIAVDGCDNRTELFGKIGAAIEDAAGACDGRLLACRVELTGKTKLHQYILCSNALLLAEARAAALALGSEVAWVERIICTTEPEVSTQVATQQGADALTSVIADTSKDATLRSQLAADIGDLVRKLPHDVRALAEDGMLNDALNGDYDKILSDASRFLEAWLPNQGA